VAAETGLVGLALFVGFLSWLLLCRWDFGGRSKNTAAGIAIIGLLVMSLTGHPLLVQGIFFMSCAIAAIVAASPCDNGSRVSSGGCQGNAGDEGEEVAGRKPMGRKAIRLPRGVWISLAGILLVLCVLHVRSIWNVLPQNFEWGFYAVEGEGKQAYRWTRGLALKLIDRDQLRPFSVRAANPDLPQRPVKVLICADDHLLKELELRDISCVRCLLDMGSPVRIVDLAQDLIKLSGLEEDAIEITYTGLRPGEKLHEELFYSFEKASATDYPKIVSIAPAKIDFERFWERLSGFLGHCDSLEGKILRQRLFDLISDCMPATDTSEQIRPLRAVQKFGGQAV
jgi:hypothetical protein